MFSRVIAAALISVSIFILSIISGDFGIETAFSQTDSTSIEVSNTSRLYAETALGLEEVISETNILNAKFVIPEEITAEDSTPDPTSGTIEGTTSDIDESEEIFKPILTQEVIEEITDDTVATSQEDLDTITDIIFILTEIADDFAEEDTDEPERPTTTLSEECQALGARSYDECDELLTIAFLPDVCREAQIKSQDACDTYLLESSTKPEECFNITDSACRVLIEEKIVESEEVTEIIEESLPEYCLKRDADTISDCVKLKEERLLSLYCRENGATTEESCNILLTADELPQACKDEGVMTIEGCRTLLIINESDETVSEDNVSATPPKVCVDNRLTADDCRDFVIKKNIDRACVEEGISNRSECNTFLIENILPGYCRDESRNMDLDACTRDLKDELKKEVRCEGSRSVACQERAIEYHLGDWIKVKKEWQKIFTALDPLKNTAIQKISTLPEDAQELIKESMTNDRPIYMHGSDGGIIIDRDNRLEALSPIVMIFDDDGDGLSNELELRLKINPNDADTDSDGFDDRTELKNGFNPSGEGTRLPGLWPIDNAMIFGFLIEQPEGSDAPIDDTFQAHFPVNGENGLSLSGIATPNTVVALYVYSPLPMVLTVETDSNGNWNYILQESLTDGEHTVYVALVNDIGDIKRRSRPLSFIISQARAVTANDLFGGSFDEAPPVAADVPVDNLRTWYLAGAVLLIVFGIIIVIIITLHSRKKSLEPPPDSDVTA